MSWNEGVSMRIQEIMTKAVFTIEPHSRLDEAAHRMHVASVRHLVVVERGAVVGVLSDRDTVADPCAV